MGIRIVTACGGDDGHHDRKRDRDAAAEASNDAAWEASGDASVDSDATPDGSVLPDAGDASTTTDGSVVPDAADASAEGDGAAPEGCPGDDIGPTPNADAAAGPVYPIPTSLWHPPPSFVPPAGTYVYLKSDNSDYIGLGQTHTYTKADSILTFTASSRLLSVNVRGDEDWRGEFQALNAADRLEVGYYPNLTRYPFNTFPQGGMSWGGEGRGCNQLTGWFAVDQVTYDCGVLTDIVMRFEQHCEGNAPALRGQIRWNAADQTRPPGPVVPPPASLWHPAPGTTPASGNYVYLVSDTGDFIGAGKAHLYTQPSATFTLRGSGAHLEILVSDADDDWSADFQAMIGLDQLVPGYYANLQRWPFHNPARGGMDWSGNGAGCNRLAAWFVVDSVTYRDGAVRALDLRFEQHCEGALAALRGALHIVVP